MINIAKKEFREITFKSIDQKISLNPVLQCRILKNYRFTARQFFSKA
ncbi:hypothetical protein [Mucilaginibacter sp.]